MFLIVVTYKIGQKEVCLMILGVHPYLRMNGNGKEAVEFYKEALEAELIGVQTYSDMPPNPEFTLPEEAKNRVIHAQLKIGNTFLMYRIHSLDNHMKQGHRLMLPSYLMMLKSPKLSMQI